MGPIPYGGGRGGGRAWCIYILYKLKLYEIIMVKNYFTKGSFLMGYLEFYFVK
jgi:hypothetical protein